MENFNLHMISFGKTWKISDALNDAVKQIGIDRRLKQQQIVNEWREIVGDAVANAATIKKFEYGRLTLTVVNAVWRQELSLAKENLREKINEVVGEEIVKEIILR